MRRRLDIAMSLIGNPPVIFLDEPTTGLDPEARIEVWETVKGLAGRGTTVLLTTQHLEDAEQLADRIAILHRGRIIENGTLAELKQLLPPVEVEYVEKQPPLEDVFFAGQTDDPRVVEIADMLELLAIRAEEAGETGADRFDDQFADLLDAAFVESAPGAERLLAILQEWGWKGWTRVERVPADRPDLSARPGSTGKRSSALRPSPSRSTG